MNKVGGYIVFNLEEMMDKNNSIIILQEMYNTLQIDRNRWNKNCGMWNLLNCQCIAISDAISALQSEVKEHDESI